MRRFFLFFAGDGGDLVKGIQRLGIAEVRPLPEDLGFAPSSETGDPTAEPIRSAEFLLATAKKASGGRDLPKVLLSAEEERRAVGELPLEDLAVRFRGLARRIEKNRRLSGRLAAMIEDLAPFAALDDPPASLHAMERFSFRAFVLSDRRESEFRAAFPEYPCDTLHRESGRSLRVMIFPAEDGSAVDEGLLRLKAQPRMLAAWRRPVREVLAHLRATAVRAEEARIRLEAERTEILPWRIRLAAAADHLYTLRAAERARRSAGLSTFAGGFSGWVASRDAETLRLFLEREFPGTHLVLRDPEPGEDVPVALENRPLIRPFEAVTDFYGRPVYGGIDPSGPLSLFFALSFGFCMTDAGYGLVLMAATALMMRRFRFQPEALKFLRLFFIGGAATVVIGAATGGWFGDLPSRALPEGSGLRRLLDGMVIINPLESGEKAQQFLLVALVVGYAQIFWGLLLRVVHSLRTRGIAASQEALCVFGVEVAVGAAVLLFVGAARGVVPTYAPKAALGVLGALFVYLSVLNALAQKELSMKLFWAVYGVYNVIAGNLIGDTLSYSRLFGLGLTTSVLAMVVNILSSMVAGIPFVGVLLAAALFVGGHLFTLAINLLGSYVHTSRLQYLEFYTKFFDGGGRPFAPLAVSREFTIAEDARGARS